MFLVLLVKGAEKDMENTGIGGERERRRGERGEREERRKMNLFLSSEPTEGKTTTLFLDGVIFRKFSYPSIPCYCSLFSDYALWDSLKSNPKCSLKHFSKGLDGDRFLIDFESEPCLWMILLVIPFSG